MDEIAHEGVLTACCAAFAYDCELSAELAIQLANGDLAPCDVDDARLRGCMVCRMVVEAFDQVDDVSVTVMCDAARAWPGGHQLGGWVALAVVVAAAWAFLL